MKYFTNKILILFIIILAIISIIWAVTINGNLSLLAEKINNETPESRINAYLKAVKTGNETLALSLWRLPEGGNWNTVEKSSLLQNNRLNITKELINKKIKSFDIVNIEWWRTCCEPGVINDSMGAGGARVGVEIMDINNNASIYIFDVFTNHEEEYQKPRTWMLRDVYSADKKPLF